MLDSLGPGNIRDVNQAVYTIFDLDERAKVRKRADLSGHPRTDVIAHRERLPRIGGHLLEAEAYPPAVRIGLEHNRFDILSNREQLRRMFQPLRPCHLGYMDKPFDARLDFNERAVVGQADDFASNVRAFRKALGHALPRIGQELFVAQRDALFLTVELEHLDLNLVADLDYVVWRLDAAPAHIDDVQQPVDSAKVDERSVVGDVL